MQAQQSAMLIASLRSITLLVAVTVASLLVGCSASPPSESDGENIVVNQIKAESEGRIRLNKFQKTNGQKSIENGVEHYRLEFKTEIEFVEDCKWLREFGGTPTFKTAKAVASKPFDLSMQAFLTDTAPFVKKGHHENLAGLIVFEKTEQGWRPMGMELTRASG